jgi:hypothetical protein
MYEVIDEPIAILTTFHKGMITPHKFRWRGRTIEIDQVNLIHRVKDGSVLSYMFSVSNSTSAYKLKFNATTMRWTLEQIYQES